LIAADPPLPDVFGDALIAARLCAIDPGLGGLILRGGGDARDAVVAALRAGLPASAPVRRVPAHIDDESLLGGIDLTATLALGKAISRTGLLERADGGMIVLPMAERLPDAIAGRIAAAMDTGDLVVERDGRAVRGAARFVLAALDDGIEPEERPAPALAERTAFWIDLSTYRGRGADLAATQIAPDGDDGEVVPLDEAIGTLAATAAALGIDSARPPLFALRAARAMALLAGRDTMTLADLAFVARMVLAPRATRYPASADDAQTDQPPPPPEPDSGDGNRDEEQSTEPGPIEDLVLDAVMAAIPRDVLARIAEGGARRRRANTMRGKGERVKSAMRGRPMGALAGMPGGGRRLSVIDTLRAAAPWQKLRGGQGRVVIRRDDLRVRRFQTRSEVLTIFAVDASGSAAAARLAEAKGAVELLLAEAYVKRAHVALIAFRGIAAELLLPPTRSLTRARRLLAELPGGGGTPLAAGLAAARELAEAARARGRTAFVIVLTDGRANIAADGRAVRSQAEADATAAAKAIRAAGIACAFVDTSARPRPEGAALAAAMGARYLPLPRADSAAMHAAISRAQPG
jgi:magnesium chelatase subunit D